MKTNWSEIVQIFESQIPQYLKVSFDEAKSDNYTFVQIYPQDTTINTIHYEWCLKGGYLYVALHFKQPSLEANMRVLQNFEPVRLTLESEMGCPPLWGSIPGRKNDTHIAFAFRAEVLPEKAARVMHSLIRLTWGHLSTVLPRERRQ